MFKLKAWLGVGAIVGIAGVFGIVSAFDDVSPWIRSGAPTIQKINELADNVLPPSSNLDCDNITARYAGTLSMHNECVVQTPLGLASDSGVTFSGASQSIRIVPPSPFIGLNPIPQQEMFYTYSSAPVFGLYIGFYTSIRDKMKPLPDNIGGVLQYTLTKGPDFMLRDASGKLLALNTGALAFSSNGNWMVADFPFMGFVRVNMATFEMQPFAVSMNANVDYTNYKAQLSISNDGRYVAVQPRDLARLSVYDLNTCISTVLPVDALNPPCKSRNYYPDIAAQIPTVKTLYKPRFQNDSQLTVTVLHDYISGSNFKVSQYVMTAPGESPTGIDYLGMGDSYASGQGAFDYEFGTDTTNNTCHLSSRSYPVMISAALFNSGHSVACSGAVMNDITYSGMDYKGQVHDGIKRIDRDNAALILSNFTPGYIVQNEFVQKYNPQAVTLSIGGNDINFADIVQQCIVIRMCYSTYEDQQELSNRITKIGNDLQNTYRAISGPGRRVYAIGYPQIVAENGNCADNVRLNDQEVKLFVDMTALLNQTIKNAAAAAGVQYVDVSDALLGHRLCETASNQVAVNGVTAGTDLGISKLKVIGAETYHPNALGHQMLMETILSRTNNLRNLNPLTTTTAQTPGSPFPYSDAPKTGRPINQVVDDAQLVPTGLTSGIAVPLSVNPHAVVLRSSASYSVTLDSGTTVGTATTDGLGQLSGSVTISPAVSCGYHTLHLNGPNILNQATDVFKVVFVASATADCDANGQPDDSQDCGLLPATGNDVDMDGIDDGCDPLISDPPAFPAQKVYLLGSSIHATQP